MSEKYPFNPKITLPLFLILFVIGIIGIALSADKLVLGKSEDKSRGNTHKGLMAYPDVEFLDPDALPIPTEPKIFSIRGIVLNRAHEPIVGAAVTARARGFEERKTTSDSQGRFVFENLTKGWWEITIEAEGYAHVTLEECVIEIPRLKDEEVRFVLDRPVEMRGKVVDETGNPIGGAKVIVAREWTADGEEVIQGHLTQDIFTTKTDEKGKFSFDQLKPGKVSLVVEHSDYTSTIENCKSDAKDVVIKLNHGGTIRGRIVDGDEPLAGVEVEINGSKLSHRQFGYAKTLTDSDGRFEARNLPYFPERPYLKAWHYSISVQAAGKEFPLYSLRLTKEQPVREVLLQPSDMAKVKELDAPYKIVDLGPPELSGQEGWPERPRGTASIRGKVIPKTRTSAQGLKVRLGGDNLFLEALVDSQSNFEFLELPSGRFRLTCEPVDLRTKREWGLFTPQKLTLSEGESKTVTLTQDSGGIRGKISGLDSKYKWYVMVMTDDLECPWFGVSNYIVSADVGQDGSYEIRNLAPGVYVASLHYWLERKTTDAEQSLQYEGTAQRHEFECDGKTVQKKDFEVRLFELTGTVVDAETRKPLKGVKLRLADRCAYHLKSRTELGVLSDADGKFHFPAVPSGQFTLKIESKHDYPCRIFLCKVADSSVDLGQLSLQKSLAGIFVQAKSPEALKKRSYHYYFPSDTDLSELNYEQVSWAMMEPDGTMLLKSLAPGRYTLAFNPEQSYSFRTSNAVKMVENLEVRPGKITCLKIDFDAGIPVQLECRAVTSHDLLPITERFWLKNEAGQQVFRFPLSHLGRWATNLAPGTYYFGASLNGGKTKSIGFQVSQESREQTIVLKLPSVIY